MKTRKIIPIFAVVAVLVSVLVVASVSADEDIGKQEKERAIALTDMPQVVQDTILKESKDFELGELLEVSTEQGLFYEADWRDGEDEVSILMSPDGKIIDRERGKADTDGEEGHEEDDD